MSNTEKKPKKEVKPPKEKTLFGHVVGTKGASMDGVFLNNPNVGIDVQGLHEVSGCSLTHCTNHIRQLLERGHVKRTKRGLYAWVIPVEDNPEENIPLEELDDTDAPSERDDNEVMADEEQRKALGFSPAPTHLECVGVTEEALEVEEEENEEEE